MRKLLSLVVVVSFALTLGACQDRPTEPVQGTDLQTAARAPAATQGSSAGQGAILFDWPFLAGFVVPDRGTGNVCVVVMNELDITDFGIIQPNGLRQVHLQDRAADLFVFTETRPIPGGGGDVVENLEDAELAGEGRFSSSALVRAASQEILNLSVNAAGTVADGRHVVCKAQFNSQGAVRSDVKLQ